MPRMSGQVIPRIPSTAPLTVRLPEEVYTLDGYYATGCTCKHGVSGFVEDNKTLVVAGAIAVLGALWWFKLLPKKGRR